MSKSLDYFKQFLYLVLMCFLIGFVLLEFRNICSATEKLLNKAESVKSFEIASVKISFDPESVTAAFSDLKMDGVDPGKRNRALQLIHDLNENEFVRLMYVGQLDGLCEYDAPADSRMRYDVATDYKLVEMKLAEMKENPHLLGQTAQFVNEQIAKLGHSANGHPLRCYVMQLTEDGANVKTALVGSFGAAFKGTSAKAVPPGVRVASQ
jgi:hypothetical protein